MSSHIKILAMDVDGPLTDGKIHISKSGELFKSFNVKDGYAIRHILPKNAIIPAIITGRSSEIVQRRAEELGIMEVLQSVNDKGAALAALTDKYKISLKETAFIGDDLNDSSALACCGWSGCPADAIVEVREQVDYICTRNGGDGAVREFIEWLVRVKED